MDQDTLIAADYNVRAWGVSGTRDGYVYITASNWADVGVYSADGAFLHRLHIDPPAGGGVYSTMVLLVSVKQRTSLPSVPGKRQHLLQYTRLTEHNQVHDRVFL